MDHAVAKVCSPSRFSLNFSLLASIETEGLTRTNFLSLFMRLKLLCHLLLLSHTSRRNEIEVPPSPQTV